MPSAIVTGATGMLGREIIIELGKQPQKWSTIHALSRSKKDDYPENVVHSHIDLTSSVDEMARELEGVSGEYLFFAAYLEKESEQEAWDVNGNMLQNFLDGLDKTGASKSLKRIILITGAKQYGVHLGQPKNPMLESDPWLRDSKWPPNFYYRQQDLVHDFCKNHPATSWVVTYPNDVIGFVKGNFMNLGTSVALYAAVSKEMGEYLVWPGSERFYSRFDCFTDSRLHAQFCIWAALEPKVANQAFNVVNGDVESWENLWPLLAKRVGLKVKEDQFLQPPPDEDVMEMAKEPPVSTIATEAGMLGKIEQSKVEQRINLVNWSQRKDVKAAWDKLAEREGLEKEAFEKATWNFLGFVLGRNFDLVISMSKARNYGWTGYIDTWESLSGVFDQLETEKILPKSK